MTKVNPPIKKNQGESFFQKEFKEEKLTNSDRNAKKKEFLEKLSKKKTVQRSKLNTSSNRSNDHSINKLSETNGKITTTIKETLESPRFTKNYTYTNSLYNPNQYNLDDDITTHTRVIKHKHRRSNSFGMKNTSSEEKEFNPNENKDLEKDPQGGDFIAAQRFSFNANFATEEKMHLEKGNNIFESKPSIENDITYVKKKPKRMAKITNDQVVSTSNQSDKDKLINESLISSSMNQSTERLKSNSK